MKLLQYINRRQATIDILRDWNNQQWKADNSRKKIREIDDRITTVFPRLGKDPVQGGGSKTEELLCAAIDQKTVAEYGAVEARRYFAEIEPCWERLTEDEKLVLTARYIDYNEHDGIQRIMSRLNVEKSKAYDLSNAALERLTKLLFW